MKLFKLKFQSTYLLNKHDLSLITQLLKSNVTLMEIFQLIKNKHNIQTIQLIVNRLEKGERIEDFFSQYIAVHYRHYFNSFIHITSLQECITNTLEMIETTKSNQRYWLKQVLPSILLFVMCFIGICIFQNIGINMIAYLANTFQQTINWLKPLDYTLSVFIVLMIILLIMIIFVLIGLKIPAVYMIMNRLLSHVYRDNLLTKYLAYHFAYYFYHFNKYGLSTYDTLYNLRYYSSTLIIYITKKIIRQCEKGNEFSNAVSQFIHDEQLQQFLKIAGYDQESHGLKNYCEVTASLIESKTKLIAKTLQIFCYGGIGLIVICIYQVLLLPMSIISSM